MLKNIHPVNRRSIIQHDNITHQLIQIYNGASADPLLCYWSYVYHYVFLLSQTQCPWGEKEISRYYVLLQYSNTAIHCQSWKAEVTLLMRAVSGRDGPGQSTDHGPVTRDLLGICGQAAGRPVLRRRHGYGSSGE